MHCFTSEITSLLCYCKLFLLSFSFGFIILQHHFRFCCCCCCCFCCFGTWTTCRALFFPSFGFYLSGSHSLGSCAVWFGFEKFTIPRFTELDWIGLNWTELEWNEMNYIHRRISIALHMFGLLSPSHSFFKLITVRLPDFLIALLAVMQSFHLCQMHIYSIYTCSCICSGLVGFANIFTVVNVYISFNFHDSLSLYNRLHINIYI